VEPREEEEEEEEELSDLQMFIMEINPSSFI
jgi:hypothetical protein